MNKPLSVARRDYLNEICNATNHSGLPAFVAAEVLERVLKKMAALAEAELRQDDARYQAALEKEGGTDDGTNP